MKMFFDFRESRRIERERHVKCVSFPGGILHANQEEEDEFE